MTSIDEFLCKYVEYNDLENVQKLLTQGACFGFVSKKLYEKWKLLK